MTDPIGDMLARIKNAYLAKKPVVFCAASNAKTAVCEILKAEGKISDFEKVKKNNATDLKSVLNYKNGEPVVTDVRRISKPGRRIYIASQDLRKYVKNIKIGIISTSSGMMSARTARKNNMGGEFICEIW